MKKSNPKVQTLILHMGYVEEQSLACLILTHRQGFNSAQEALLSLRGVFQLVVEQETENIYLKECCRDAKRFVGVRYCSQCGTLLNPPKESPRERFEAYFKGVHDGNNGCWEALEGAGWMHDYHAIQWTNAVVVDSADDLLDDSSTLKEEIEDDDEPHLSSHITFLNPKMSEMLFKR